MTHLAQPTHLTESTSAEIPLYISIASTGQTFTQAPQATHSFCETIATDVFFVPITGESHPYRVLISLVPLAVCDKLTKQRLCILARHNGTMVR